MANRKGKSHTKCCGVCFKIQHKIPKKHPATKENLQRTVWLCFIFGATIGKNRVMCANYFLQNVALNGFSETF